MPELPDIVAYVGALESRIVNQPLERVRLASPFLLRTTQPTIAEVEGRTVRELRRIGKRIAIGLEGDFWLVLHLMIAGRLHWRPPKVKLAGITPMTWRCLESTVITRPSTPGSPPKWRSQYPLVRRTVSGAPG